MQTDLQLERKSGQRASLAVQRVTSASSPEFATLVAIYTAAHPASERKPIDLLTAMVQRPDYLFLVVTREQTVVGFSITLLFSASDACLLEYMAIAEEWRGQGIGQFLFRQLVTMPEVAARYLLAEVDSDKQPSADSADFTRRKQFYRKLGAREVAGLNYLMPPVSTATPPPMDILVYRLALPAMVAKTQLRAWLEAIYVNVYRMPPDDPRLDTMTAKLPGNIPLI